MKHLFVAMMLLFSTAAFADECINVNRIWDWRVTGSNRLEVRESRRVAYEVRTFSCFDLDLADSLGFETTPRGATWFCRGDRLHLYGFGNRYYGSCTVRTIEKL